jgi:hypothetical protein
MRFAKRLRSKRPLITFRARLPQTREVWLVSIGWHISAVFLFLALWLFQDSPEMSLLALFVALYVHIVVHRRLAERKLKAYDKKESLRQKKELEVLRKELTTNLDTTTHNLRKELTTNLDTTTHNLRKELTTNLDTTTHNLRKELTTHLDTTTHNLRKELLSTTTRLSRESYISASAISYLDQQIHPKIPIWFSHGWAASPEMLAYLFDLVIARKPKFVLDLGSGLTTVIAGYAVQKNRTGSVESWEHLPMYAKETADLIAQHNLENWATVTTNPLKKTVVGNKNFEWFSRRPKIGTKIDLLVVDSPPGVVGTMARYPALPILRSFMSDDFVVILDDIHRPEEEQTIEAWQSEWSSLNVSIKGESSKSKFAILSRNITTA